MSKIPLDLLKRYITGEAKDASGLRAEATFTPPTDIRSRLECSLPVAATLLVVANLDLAIDGFPDRIPLPSPGRNSRGLGVARDGTGIWRLQGSRDALKAAEAEGLFDPERLTVLLSVLKALDVPAKGDALHRLAQIGSWEGEPINLAFKVQAVAKVLPPHVLHATLGHGASILDALDAGSGVDEIEAWVDSVLSLGIGPNVPPHADIPPATVACAIRMASEGLHALMRVGGDIEARSAGGLTPFLAAVRHAGYYGIFPTVEWGANLHAVDAEGRGALHQAATDLTQPRRGHLREVVRTLLAMGCDPHATDNEGRTPANLLWAWAETAAPSPGDETGTEVVALVAQHLDGLAPRPHP